MQCICSSWKLGDFGHWRSDILEQLPIGISIKHPVVSNTGCEQFVNGMNWREWWQLPGWESIYVPDVILCNNRFWTVILLSYLWVTDPRSWHMIMRFRQTYVTSWITVHENWHCFPSYWDILGLKFCIPVLLCFKTVPLLIVSFYNLFSLTFQFLQICS